MAEGTKWLGVRLEKSLHDSLRIRSIEEDRPVSEIVRDAIERYLEKNAKQPKAAKASA